MPDPNPLRGEVPLAVAATGKAYRLRFGIASLKRLEGDLNALYPGTRHAAVKYLVGFLRGIADLQVSEQEVHALLRRGLEELQPSLGERDLEAIREAAGLKACVQAIQEAALASCLEIREGDGRAPPPDPLPPPGT